MQKLASRRSGHKPRHNKGIVRGPSPIDTGGDLLSSKKLLADNFSSHMAGFAGACGRPPRVVTPRAAPASRTHPVALRAGHEPGKNYKPVPDIFD